MTRRTATILLAALSAGCGEQAREGERARVASPAPARPAPAVSHGYRFVRPPVVIYTGRKYFEFTAFVRLNRAAPRHGRILASLALDGQSDLSGIVREPTRRACYSEAFEVGDDAPRSIRAPRDGQLMRVTYKARGGVRLSARVRARHVTVSEYTNDAKRTRFLRALGCEPR